MFHLSERVKYWAKHKGKEEQGQHEQKREGGRWGGGEKKRVTKTHISVLTDPHPQPNLHLHQAHNTGVVYQGGTGESHS